MSPDVVGEEEESPEEDPAEEIGFEPNESG